MKYNVGDTVIVRDDLVEYTVRYRMEHPDYDHPGYIVIPSMLEFAGKPVTISGVYKDGAAYDIEEDALCAYTDEMFVGLANEEVDDIDFGQLSLLLN